MKTELEKTISWDCINDNSELNFKNHEVLLIGVYIPLHTILM